MVCACCRESEDMDLSMNVQERVIAGCIHKVLCCECLNEIETIVFQTEAYIGWAQCCDILRRAVKQYNKKGKHTDAMLMNSIRVQNNKVYTELRHMTQVVFDRVAANKGNDGDTDHKVHEPSRN